MEFHFCSLPVPQEGSRSHVAQTENIRVRQGRFPFLPPV